MDRDRAQDAATVAADEHPVEPTGRWKQHAACGGSALEQFFEHRVVGGRPHAAAYRVAERFCAVCPVVLACRAEADATEVVGLWGGQWYPTLGSRLQRPVNLLLPARSDTGN